MKRKTILHSLLCMMLSLIILSSSNIYAAKIMTLGDINQDNKVDSRDQLLMMRHITASARKTHPEWILTGDKLKLADVTQNGRVDNSDMLKILRYIAAKRNPDTIGKNHKDWLELKKIDLNPTIEVTSIKLSKTKYDFDMNGVKLIVLVAIIEPTNATDKTIRWKSSNNNIAEVDSNGKVIAKGNGTAIITATTNNGKTAECTITVTTSPKSIVLNKTNINLDMSGTKTEQLIAKVNPETATNKTVTYSSSNEKVATVDSSGKVTAKANGTAIITATTNNGKTAKCTVNVITNPTGIKLNKSTVSLEINKTHQLTATVVPNTSSNKTVTWSSSNTKIATVDNSGKVTAKGEGTAIITAKTNNNKKAECRITVQNLKITGGQSIAESAVQLACTAYPENKMYVAWPDTRIYNNKTKAYVDARERLIKGKNLDGGEYASCDMGVATAVRYSGVDKNMEYRTIYYIWIYLENSKDWRIVGTCNGSTTSNLKPGDVLINEHHILIYTGNSVVKKKYPKSTADMYEAGYATYYNGSYYPALYKLNLRWDIRESPFTVFRNVNADKKIYNKILK